MTKISLDAQITAVELEILSRKAHVENLERLVLRKERQPHHVADAAKLIPAMEAALKTLKWLKSNEEIIREKISQKKV